MLRLMSVELLKIRRSLSLLMMFAVPMMVLALNLLMLLKQHQLDKIGASQWLQFWMGTTGSWCYFMLPLYTALVAALLNGHEHKNQTWRLMLTLPVSMRQLYVVKFALAWLFVMGATLVLIAATALTVGALGIAGANMAHAYSMPLAPLLLKLALCCVPVVVIQHALSWRFQNLVLPLAVGVIATMGIIQIGSSAHWVWYPWTYPLMGMAGGDIGKQDQALLLSAAVGAALFAASAWLLGRREVQS